MPNLTRWKKKNTEVTQVLPSWIEQIQAEADDRSFAIVETAHEAIIHMQAEVLIFKGKLVNLGETFQAGDEAIQGNITKDPELREMKDAAIRNETVRHASNIASLPNNGTSRNRKKRR